MAHLNVMPLLTDAYTSDTMHLSTEQHGAYLLLLIAMWRAGGELPDDAEILQRITRVSSKRWPKMWEAIGPFFTSIGNRKLFQKRLKTEWDKASHRKAVAQANGTMPKGTKSFPSGSANALKSHDVSEAVGRRPLEQEPSGSKAKLNPEAKPEPKQTASGSPTLSSSSSRESLTPTSSVAARAGEDQEWIELRKGIVQAYETMQSKVLTPDTHQVDLWRTTGFNPSVCLTVVKIELAKMVAKGDPPTVLKFYNHAIKRAHDDIASGKVAPTQTNGGTAGTPGAKPFVADDEHWRTAMRIFLDGGKLAWIGPGPRPDLQLPGCLVPQRILDEFKTYVPQPRSRPAPAHA